MRGKAWDENGKTRSHGSHVREGRTTMQGAQRPSDVALTSKAKAELLGLVALSKAANHCRKAREACR